MTSDWIMSNFIQKEDYKMALRKYYKALRYMDVWWEKEDIDEGAILNSSENENLIFLLK